MNYRHLYHFGSFADVVKHCVLLALLNALKSKDKPFCVLDTHAGIGLYPLQAAESQKTKEFESGIIKLLAQDTSQAPALIQQYIELIAEYNDLAHVDFYLGSPLLIANSLRPDDRLIATELHEEDVRTLKQNLPHHSHLAVHHMDGYQALKAFIPPKEKRGLVLIDPPFEKTTELENILEHLAIALKHWRGGVYAIWYPIKDKHKIKKFYRKLADFELPIHFIEFSQTYTETPSTLHTCGLAIINMPWQVPHLLREDILPYLGKALDCRWHMQAENLA